MTAMDRLTLGGCIVECVEGIARTVFFALHFLRLRQERRRGCLPFRKRLRSLNNEPIDLSRGVEEGGA